MKVLFLIATVAVLITFSSVSYSFGHGLGYEILPPVKLGDRNVALEVKATPSDDPTKMKNQITISLFEPKTTNQVKEVTYKIKASKSSEFLFEETFQTGNGALVMDFTFSKESSLSVEKRDSGTNFFGSLFSPKQDAVVVQGPSLDSGGLYQFQVEILTADSFSNKLAEPITYQVGVSIPDTTDYKIIDPNFGEQQISVITYYDKVEDFRYDHTTRAITFSMPFEWNYDNINQTSVVHEEIVIPKTFGDLLVPDVSAYVNDVNLPENLITIDEFSEFTRIIHLIINQESLFDIYKTQENTNKMNFLVKPSSIDSSLSTITANGQYRISVNWEPPLIKSGAKTIFYFDITDVFLKNRPVAVDYELSIIHQGEKIFEKNGVSSKSKEERNSFEFEIPQDVSGPITLQFDNLGDNNLARIGIPIVVDRVDAVKQDAVMIPNWVKNNAGWWADGLIGDSDFTSGIQFMIQENIIEIPNLPEQASETSEDVPDWVRNNAGWWADEKISDSDFIKGIQYLIENGIMKVN